MSIINLTWTVLESNPELRGEKPSTKILFIYIYIYFLSHIKTVYIHQKNQFNNVVWVKDLLRD